MNRFSNHAVELLLVSIPNVTHPSAHRALVAPLFGLFFMAIFVPWATAFGTIIGAVCGLAVVSTIYYWQDFTGTEGISFLCALPLGLLVQIVVGMCVSLLPIRRIGSGS